MGQPGPKPSLSRRRTESSGDVLKLLRLLTVI